MTHTTYKNTKSMLIVGSIAALGILALVNPASAYYGNRSNSNDVNVSSENNAIVINEVMVGANTGHNNVDGGNTGRAGDGGDASGHRANAGDGGTSGNSWNDGAIGTGNATAIGTINNDVNSNRTKVTTDCNCVNRHNNGGDTNVYSGNNAMVGNGLGVLSNTGKNDVDGGTTGQAGQGGDASAHSWSLWKSYNQGGANAGNGGNTGSTGNVGTVLTGHAVADGLVVNVVNRNVTRVAR